MMQSLFYEYKNEKMSGSLKSVSICLFFLFKIEIKVEQIKDQIKKLAAEKKKQNAVIKQQESVIQKQAAEIQEEE